MTPNDFKLSEHFKLSEFQDRSNNNLVVVHPLLITRLEALRDALCTALSSEIAITISSGTRTPRTNCRLAKILGWTHDNGLVARNSRHLPKHHGAAADITAIDLRTSTPVPRRTLALHAATYFDKVIHRYSKHIHVDLRDSIDSKGQSIHDPKPTEASSS